MDGLVRVTFRFADDLEVRYLPGVPRQGEFVAHREELWMVTYVSSDAGGVMVVCESRSGHGRDLRVA